MNIDMEGEYEGAVAFFWFLISDPIKTTDTSHEEIEQFELKGWRNQAPLETKPVYASPFERLVIF